MLVKSSLLLSIISLLSFGSAEAQERDPAADTLTSPVPSVLLAGDAPGSLYEVGPWSKAPPRLFQLEEEDDWGSFLIGALVGTFVAFAYLESDPATRTNLLLIPIGTLIGGILFAAMGIG